MILSGSLVQVAVAEATAFGIVVGFCDNQKHLVEILYDGKVGKFFKSQFKIID